jgi:hypothetical protein
VESSSGLTHKLSVAEKIAVPAKEEFPAWLLVISTCGPGPFCGEVSGWGDDNDYTQGPDE